MVQWGGDMLKMFKRFNLYADKIFFGYNDSFCSFCALTISLVVIHYI